MKLIYDNQALKLHTALIKLRKHPLRSGRTLDVLSDFFKVDIENVPLITQSISQLHNHVFEIKNFCTGVTFLEKQYNKWSGPINQAFLNIHLPSNYSNFLSSFNDEHLFLLETTHDALVDKYRHFKLIDQSLIDDLIQSLNDKLTETLQSQASDKVKLYVKKQLQTLINDLENYNFLGLENIHKTIDSTIGHIVTDSDYKAYAQTTEGKNLFGELLKITGLLEITESATQSLLNIQQLIQIGVGG